jgi:hypothetical protein
MVEHLRYGQTKSPIKQFLYEELEEHEHNTESTIAKCALMKDDWECLGTINRVLEPFKEGQKICEAQKYVTLSLVHYHHDNPLGIGGARRRDGTRACLDAISERIDQGRNHGSHVSHDC